MTPDEFIRTIARMDPDNEPTDPGDWEDTLVSLIGYARDLVNSGQVAPAPGEVA